MNQIKYKQKGISLIEVMVSAVVLAMIFLWISEGHLDSLSTIADSNDRGKVTWLVEDMMERIKINPILDSYKNEINSVDASSSYCSSRIICSEKVCTSSEIVKFDVQQVICDNLDGLRDLSVNFNCFSITDGATLNSCSTRGVVRGRFSVSWDSRNTGIDSLSTYSEAVFTANLAMNFNGSHLEVDGNLLGNNFTIAMWVRPANAGSWRGLFGRHETGTTPLRSPSLWVSPSRGLHWDSFTRTLSGDERHGDVVGKNTFFSVGVWTHITWVKSGESYIIYRNGTLFNTSEGITGAVLLKNKTWIGAVDTNFIGDLDDIQVYSGAVTRSDIETIMSGRRITNRVMTLHLDFDGESFNDAITDKSGNDRTVIVNGRGAGRVTDNVSGCTNVAQGSPNVKAGG